MCRLAESQTGARSVPAPNTTAIPAAALARALGARYRWFIWAALTMVYFNQLVQMFAYSVLIPALLSELQLSYTLAGALTSAYMLSLSSVMIPVGALGDKIGGRVLMLGGLAAMVAGTAVFALASSYPMALASRVLVGAGAGVALVLPPAMLAYWLEKGQYRVLIGLHLSVGKIGSVVAMWVLPPLVVALGWRLGYATISLLGPLALLFCFVFLANRPTEVGLTGMHTLAVSSPQPARRAAPGLPWRTLARSRNLLLLALSEFLIFANYFGMTNWLPTYFKVRGSLSDVEAGFQTGFILWGTIIGYALSGPAVNLVGRGAPIFSAGAAISAVLTAIFATGALVALPSWTWPAIMLVYGLSVSIMVLTLPIMTAIVPASSLATANGVVLALGYLGAMASPPLIGAVADATGTLSLGFWVPVATSACASVTSALIREHEGL